MFKPEDVISTYSRAEALEDGVIVDVSAQAREAGFKAPLALTKGAWDTCVAVPPELQGKEGQDEASRLHEILFIANVVARLEGHSDQLFFGVRVMVAVGLFELRRLSLHCGPGDDGEPVMTILLEGED